MLLNAMVYLILSSISVLGKSYSEWASHEEYYVQ